MDRTMVNASVTATSAVLFAAAWVAIIHADEAAAVAQPQQVQVSTASPVVSGGAAAAASGQLVPVPAAPGRVQAAPVRRSRAS